MAHGADNKIAIKTVGSLPNIARSPDSRARKFVRAQL
jgi:hypothetical protein